jgi:hypothetical protein
LELAPGIILPDYFFGGGVKEWFYWMRFAELRLFSFIGLLPEAEAVQRQVQAGHAHAGAHQRKALPLHGEYQHA